MPSYAPNADLKVKLESLGWIFVYRFLKRSKMASPRLINMDSPKVTPKAQCLGEKGGRK